MKQFIFIIFFVSLCFSTTKTQTQTNTNIPQPENVLVVYRPPIDLNDSIGIVSQAIKNYYVNARGIPTSNVVPLDSLGDYNITVGGETHTVGIRQETDIIRDIDNGSWYATEHSWKYFLRYVANPIKQYITNNNLTSTIRYIVLCKGVPSKIQAGGDYSMNNGNVAVDGLLCMLNSNNYESLLSALYTYYRSGSNPPPYYNYRTPTINNPYYSTDPGYTFDYRFKPDHFTTSWNGFSIKLSYLVSHLDGTGYNVVVDMIDRSLDPDVSGTAFWVLDDDPTMAAYTEAVQFSTTKYLLESKGFNVVYNNTNNWITSHPNNVMGFSSWGTHSEDGNCGWEDSAWVIDSLNFNLSNGAIFNTFESFNGTSLTTLVWRHINNTPPSCNHTQGLATQFLQIGGTAVVAHAWEPFYVPLGANDNTKTFPSYAMGYNLIDAFYKGQKYLGWVNMVVGDPLTAIAWGKQSLTSNLNWSGTNLVTGEIDISDLKTLTVANNSVINLRHQGFITGEGKLILGQNVTFNLYSWQKGLFLSYDSDNPRLVWGAHPTLGSGANYRVYRKFGIAGSWELIATTSAKEYKDLQMQFSVIGDEADNLFYKVIAFSELPGTYESNIVACTGNKAPKKIIANQNLNSPVEYSLEQNYPNPFNPTTQINYSIKEAGLVQLKIYDILGKEIANLVNKNKEAGNYSVDFNAAELPSGVYIYQLTAPGFTQARKMILAK
jgi:hypothetical protein